jgi:hypothetical protein
VLVVAALAGCLLLTLAVALLAVRLRGIRRTYARLSAGGVEGEDVLAAVARQLAAIDRLDGKLRVIGRQTAENRQLASKLVRSVGVHRYDAFPDTGGQLSWSTALLDEAGDGVVLTAINGRAESRSYAKRVEGGGSAHNLSEEEQLAIAMAMGRPAPPATIRL